MAPTRFRNVSGLLVAFILLSTLAHGLSLLLSLEPVLHPVKQKIGSTIISAVLTPAKEKPAVQPSRTKASLSPLKESPKKNSPLTKTTEASKHEASNIPITPQSKKESPQLQNIQQITQDTVSPEPPAPPTNNVAVAETAQHAINQLEEQRNYVLGELQNRLNRHLIYPIRARKRGWQGEVLLTFTINKLGKLNNVRLAKSSGYSLLDKSAVTAFAKLDQIILPTTMGQLQTMELQLPVRYELRES